MNLSQIPGYTEAVAQESFLRDASFVPVNESICGIEIAPLTVGHLSILQSIGSPFVCGGVATPLDVMQFLYITSPLSGKPKTFKRWKFRRKIGKLKYVEALNAISVFIGEAFADSPGSKNSKAASISYYSLSAALVGLIAREYHWSEREIMSLPLKRLWQYRAEILANRGDKSIGNPSDRKIQEWLDRKAN